MLRSNRSHNSVKFTLLSPVRGLFQSSSYSRRPRTTGPSRSTRSSWQRWTCRSKGTKRTSRPRRTTRSRWTLRPTWTIRRKRSRWQAGYLSQVLRHRWRYSLRRWYPTLSSIQCLQRISHMDVIFLHHHSNRSLMVKIKNFNLSLVYSVSAESERSDIQVLCPFAIIFQ